MIEIFSSMLQSRYKSDIENVHRLHIERKRSQDFQFALPIVNSLPEDKQPEAKLVLINALLKQDNADADEPPKKDKPSDNESPS